MCKSETPSRKDGSIEHSWFIEDKTANNGNGSLTNDGLEFIAAHKYKPGHYTFLDNLLNPFWTWITDLLPMTIAPNAVTAMGGFHCGMAYALLWYYSPNLDQVVPDWVVFFSGYCTIAYYTFDCMDGKQARRTGMSTPLGQLFDHGFDCLCTVSHVSTTAGYVMIGGSHWYMLMQNTLQFSFFMAQWEEYYTHILPHAMGNFGVTELNYGIGLFTILNSFVDREKVWMSKVVDTFPTSITSALPEVVTDLEMRHFALMGWFVVLSTLVCGSMYRVMTHEHVKTNGTQFSAVSKLCMPLLITAAPFILPPQILFDNNRPVSIASGLLFSMFTKKMIVFSMAKMTFATFQSEALPLFLTFLWIRCDSNITETGAGTILCALALWYVYRLLSWASTAIDQICNRLDIYCFSIKKKTKAE